MTHQEFSKLRQRPGTSAGILRGLCASYSIARENVAQARHDIANPASSVMRLTDAAQMLERQAREAWRLLEDITAAVEMMTGELVTEADIADIIGDPRGLDFTEEW